MESDSSGSGRIGILREPSDTTTAGQVTFEHREILDAIDVSIVLLDRNFSIASFNRPAAETLDLAVSDVGRPAREIAGLANLRNLELGEFLVRDART